MLVVGVGGVGVHSRVWHQTLVEGVGGARLENVALLGK